MLGQAPILPRLVHIEAATALRRWGDIYGYRAFLSSLTGPQTKRKVLKVPKMAKKRGFAHGLPYWGLEISTVTKKDLI